MANGGYDARRSALDAMLGAAAAALGHDGAAGPNPETPDPPSDDEPEDDAIDDRDRTSDPTSEVPLMDHLRALAAGKSGRGGRKRGGRRGRGRSAASRGGGGAPTLSGSEVPGFLESHDFDDTTGDDDPVIVMLDSAEFDNSRAPRPRVLPQRRNVLASALSAAASDAGGPVSTAPSGDSGGFAVPSVPLRRGGSRKRTSSQSSQGRGRGRGGRSAAGGSNDRRGSRSDGTGSDGSCDSRSRGPKRRRGGRGRWRPGEQRSGYTYYDMTDVGDSSEKVNAKAAFSFLDDLRRRRTGEDAPRETRDAPEPSLEAPVIQFKARSERRSASATGPDGASNDPVAAARQRRADRRKKKKKVVAPLNLSQFDDDDDDDDDNSH